MCSPDWDHSDADTQLMQLVAAAADLCRKPLRHAVLVTQGETDLSAGFLDCTLQLQTRNDQGERLHDQDLEVEIYRSGSELNLTLAWTTLQERPMLWHGTHAVWMNHSTGCRCERPEEGLPLEALARRLRAHLAGQS
jgi:hypothetical protein